MADYFLPGYGVVIETTAADYLLPGYGVLIETEAAAAAGNPHWYYQQQALVTGVHA